MRLTFVIADLHGRFDLLDKAFVAIPEYVMNHGYPKMTIITLGDYVDRGPDSKNIIGGLMFMQDKGHNLICLKGNHEAMMVETIRKPLHPDWWLGNGGNKTLMSYGHPPRGAYDPSVVPEEHLEWLDKLPIMHIDEHRVYVHGGVDPTRQLHEQGEDLVTWWLYPDEMQMGHGDFHVVHGHHQHEDGPKLYTGRTNLDTGAWYTGRLVVGVFDDEKPGGPIDTIEIKGEPK